MTHESVWNYPRPPRVEVCGHRLRVEFNGVTVADTTRGYRSAQYWNLQVGRRVSAAAVWGYPMPARAYELLIGHLAFYASRVDSCFVDDERVQPQPGDFYGGWITSNLVGPFRGVPGSRNW